jgi:hypothetical protein
MKFITIVLLLLGGQHTFAANLPASLMSAQAKLASLKSQLDADISGLPNIPLPKLQPKTSVPLTGQVPDFENRKVTLETLKAKLSAMQAAQLKEGKPNPAFLAEMKQTLEESLAVKMVKLEVPKFNPNAPKPIIPVAKKVSNPRLATVEKRIRNVENFTAELYRLHDEFTNVHRLMLEDTRVERMAMTNVVFGVYHAFVDSLGKIITSSQYQIRFLIVSSIIGRTTEDLWQTRQAVQDLIDYDESIGAVADCVNEQKERFADRNRYFGQEINTCSEYVLSRAETYFATTFYQFLNIMMILISQLQELVLGTSSITNFARDQEALIVFLEKELNSVEELWNNNLLVILQWEERRFDDEMLGYRSELDECLAYVESSYERVAAEIMTALEGCAVPTRGRPMQLKPKA